jgi:hypothetical protein
MARNWRCLLGRHEWREVRTPDRDRFAECSRCGKHDRQRLIPQRVETKFRGGGMAPWGDPGGH